MTAPSVHRSSLVDKLLAEQRRPGTAVARFSGWHDEPGSLPLQARHYRDLIPLAKPDRGQQYAFEVDLDRCTGCKACVTACHSLNGLDDQEIWRDTGLLVGDESTSYQQTITGACHHCADPACADGCPVLAYEKDPGTGIVRHLDDQCIGCSYCILKCPYDVPKFNLERGIVRKCDMCRGRLAAGEAPACVQACPTSAIAIRIVSMADLRGDRFQPTRPSSMLPGLVDSSYTHPSTRYLSSKPVPETATAADAETPRAEPAHLPLAVMLLLTQFAAGAILFSRGPAMRWTGFISAVLGIAASVAHLGQPLKAWRCFLGWRKSWLSREILALGAFAAAALGAAMGIVPASIAGVAGLAAVLCSAMVYADTRRPFWAMRWTAPGFGGTMLLAGAALAACGDPSFAPVAAILGVMKLGWGALYLAGDHPRDRRSQRLLLGPLRQLHAGRFAAGLLGIALMLSVPMAGFACLMAGELMERLIFFRGAAAWKMPGNA